MHLNDARNLALGHCRVLEREDIPLDAAMGRVLAERIRAERDVPSESRSRFDGYAVRSVDLGIASPERPKMLSVQSALIAAGHAVDCQVGPGECVRIMTGGLLPKGADAVLAQESVILGSGGLGVHQPCSVGDGVFLPGTDARQGETVLDAGDVLTPTRMALAAGLGLGRISVVRKPKVAILSTGDEVQELGEPLGETSMPCNTRYLLAWSVGQQGGLPFHLGTVKDDPEAVATRVAEADVDLVISTGGMGRGDRDYILAAWEMLGVHPLFSEVNLSPGRRSAVGVGGNGKLLCGLPGSPWGAQVVFVELLSPMLRFMQGVNAWEPFSVQARLTRPIKNRTDGFKAVRGTLEISEGAVRFAPGGNPKTSRFSGLKSEPAYALVEAERSEVRAGELVLARLHDFPLLASPLISVVN
ncbi:MAG: molybdopterin molybdotransferase MoeA [Syntrophobacteraceae bacterium]